MPSSHGDQTPGREDFKKEVVKENIQAFEPRKNLKFEFPKKGALVPIEDLPPVQNSLSITELPAVKKLEEQEPEAPTSQALRKRLLQRLTQLKSAIKLSHETFNVIFVDRCSRLISYFSSASQHFPHDQIRKQDGFHQ